jgi:hypothetical protein
MPLGGKSIFIYNHILSAPRACDANEFRCDDGMCVPTKFRCDDTFDCIDQSDERGCGRWTKMRFIM